MEAEPTRFYVLLGFFLLINFGGLAIGGLLQGGGPSSDWYLSLDRAPWTPPGWVFGAAWFTIMLCFSIYLAYLYRANWSFWVIGLFVAAVLLNVSWNPIFFRLHLILPGLIILVLLLLVLFTLMIGEWKHLHQKSFLLLPYVVWLVLAISLNGYVFWNN